MATVTVLTADRMLEIEAESVVSGVVNSAGHLILTRHDGTTIDAGYVVDSTNNVNRVGDQTIAGVKTFSSAPVVPANAFPESAVANLVTDLAAKATDTAVVHLAGAETITGVKTFSSAPVVPVNAFPESAVANLVADLAAKAADSSVVHLTGAETIAGVKTFSSAPVVPANSFPESAITNLTADLAAKAADNAVVHLAGAETIAGAKTFSAQISGPRNIPQYHGNPFPAYSGAIGSNAWTAMGGGTSQLSINKVSATSRLLMHISFSCFANTAGRIFFGIMASQANPPTTGSVWVEGYVAPTGQHMTFSAVLGLAGAAGTWYIRPGIYPEAPTVIGFDVMDHLSLSVEEVLP